MAQGYQRTEHYIFKHDQWYPDGSLERVHRIYTHALSKPDNDEISASCIIFKLFSFIIHIQHLVLCTDYVHMYVSNNQSKDLIAETSKPLHSCLKAIFIILITFTVFINLPQCTEQMMGSHTVCMLLATVLI